MLFYWVFVITRLFGERNMVSGIVVGSTMSVFLLFQLPRLLSPHVQIVPIEAGYSKPYELDRPKDRRKKITNREDGKETNVKYTETLIPRLNECCERFLHIANTGINNYENWSIHLILDPAIKVDRYWLNQKYKDHQHIQCRRQGTEKDGETIVYSPKSGYSLGPNQDLIIGFKVAVESGDSVIRLEINSSHRWGDTVKYFSLQVKE